MCWHGANPPILHPQSEDTAASALCVLLCQTLVCRANGSVMDAWRHMFVLHLLLQMRHA